MKLTIDNKAVLKKYKESYYQYALAKADMESAIFDALYGLIEDGETIPFNDDTDFVCNGSIYRLGDISREDKLITLRNEYDDEFDFWDVDTFSMQNILETLLSKLDVNSYLLSVFDDEN